MTIKFLADADLRVAIVSGVRRRIPEIDFKFANEAELEGVADPDVLAVAAAEKRLLVTHDRRTMPTHFGEFIGENVCWGVFVILKRMKTRDAIDELVSVWQETEAADHVDSIRFLPLRKVRT